MKRNLYRQNIAIRPSRRRWSAVLLLISAILLTACGGSDRESDERLGELRIVSFSPALSRMVVDLGLGNHIVGRTQYCEFVNQDVPVVGDLLNVDYERVLGVFPTHVLIQSPMNGADRKLLELCEEHHWKVGQWSSIDTIDDIEQVVRDLPGVLYENDATSREEVTRRATDLLNQIALALTPGDSEVWRDEVMLVYRTEPIAVFGRQTYLSEVLERLGAKNAVEKSGWIELSLEDVTRLNPPAVIVLSSSNKGNATESLGDLENLQIDAVKNGRVVFLRNSSAMLPSTGIIDVANDMRKALKELSAKNEARTQSP